MDRTCQQEGSFKENKNYKETDACNQKETVEISWIIIMRKEKRAY